MANPCMAVSSLYNNAMPAPASLVNSSMACGMHRTAGYVVPKEITLTGGAGAKTYNCFVLSGSVEMRGLYGIFTDVTNVVTVSTAYWDVNDGTNTVVLTKATGVDCSGAALNSEIVKADIAANAASFANSNQCRMVEIGFGVKALQSFLLVSKNGTTTNLRFQVTQDANTNAKIMMYGIWVCRNPGSTFVAA